MIDTYFDFLSQYLLMLVAFFINIDILKNPRCPCHMMHSANHLDRLSCFQAQSRLRKNVGLLHLRHGMHPVKPEAKDCQQGRGGLHFRKAIPKHWFARQLLCQV